MYPLPGARARARTRANVQNAQADIEADIEAEAAETSGLRARKGIFSIAEE